VVRARDAAKISGHVAHANKEVAARLGINQRTVELHRALVMKKMHASSLSELVRLEIAARE